MGLAWNSHGSRGKFHASRGKFSRETQGWYLMMHEVCCIYLKIDRFKSRVKGHARTLMCICTDWHALASRFCWLCWGLTSQSTIFQSCRDGAIASWVSNQYFRGVKCLAQGHNTAAVGLEPRTSRSGVWHSTTEPPRSPPTLLCMQNVSNGPRWNCVHHYFTHRSESGIVYEPGNK